jgi:hypothetical protein
VATPCATTFETALLPTESPFPFPVVPRLDYLVGVAHLVLLNLDREQPIEQGAVSRSQELLSPPAVSHGEHDQQTDDEQEDEDPSQRSML